MTCTCGRPATWLAAAYPEGHKDKALRKPLCDRCMAWAARLGRELGLLVDVVDLTDGTVTTDARQLRLFN